MLESLIHWIAEEDPINLFVLTFSLLALVALLRTDSRAWGYDLWRIRRQDIFCPLRGKRARIVRSTKGSRQDPHEVVESCSIWSAEHGFSCDQSCLRLHDAHAIRAATAPSR